MPADDVAWIAHAPAPVRAAYCMAWHTDRALWLSAWQPGERAHVRLTMRRVCRG
jgi:hypothetical protein